MSCGDNMVDMTCRINDNMIMIMIMIMIVIIIMIIIMCRVSLGKYLVRH